MREEKYLKKALKAYAARRLEIISITLEPQEARQAVEAHIRKNDLEWPFYFDGRFMDNALVRDFGITGVPLNLLLDRSGRILSTEREVNRC